MPRQLTPITSGDTYSDDDDVDSIYGRDDVNAYADVDADQDAGKISANKELARQYWFAHINQKLQAAGFTSPATSENFPFFGKMKYIEAEGAGAWLYFKRGKQDANSGENNASGSMQWHWNHAESELADVIADAMRVTETVESEEGGFSFVDLNTPTCTNDEYSGDQWRQ